MLYLNGKDLRTQPLIERKRELRKVVPKESADLAYVDHVEGEGGPIRPCMRTRLGGHRRQAPPEPLRGAGWQS